MRADLQLASAIAAVSLPLTMMSRGRSGLLPAVVFLSAVFLLSSCRRVRIESPAEAARPAHAATQAAELLKRTFPNSPLRPADVPLGITLRLLAPPGYFDRYDPADFEHEDIPLDASLYRRGTDGTMTSVSRTIAKSEPARGSVYIYRRAAGVVRFEKDYGLRVAITHFTADEMQKTGITAARAREFDLVFGPRHMLPFVADEGNLAPFKAANLKRFAPVQMYITEALGHLPPDLDLDFCIPYYRCPIGIGYSPQIATDIPRHWADGFEFEGNELYWHRVALRRNPFVLLGAAALYQRSLDKAAYDRSQAAMAELIQSASALIGDKGSADNKAAALQQLRQKFAAAAHRQHQAEAARLDIHVAEFTSSNHEAYRVRNLNRVEVTGHEDPRFEASELANSTANLVKKALIFGAEFVDESPQPKAASQDDWAFIVGSSGDQIVRLPVEEKYVFSLPEPQSPVELDVFVQPANRTAPAGRVAECFIDYLLIPQVAASMTVFTAKANLVRDANAFVPFEIANSAIYSLPARDDIVYLPIIARDSARFQQVWQEILDFQISMKALSENSSGTQKTVTKAKVATGKAK